MNKNLDDKHKRNLKMIYHTNLEEGFETENILHVDLIDDASNLKIYHYDTFGLKDIIRIQYIKRDYVDRFL